VSDVAKSGLFSQALLHFFSWVFWYNSPVHQRNRLRTCQFADDIPVADGGDSARAGTLDESIRTSAIAVE
jgi:hypothetical protein